MYVYSNRTLCTRTACTISPTAIGAVRGGHRDGVCILAMPNRRVAAADGLRDNPHTTGQCTSIQLHN